jgi:hypothetical protein
MYSDKHINILAPSYLSYIDAVLWNRNISICKTTEKQMYCTAVESTTYKSQPISSIHNQNLKPTAIHCNVQVDSHSLLEEPSTVTILFKFTNGDSIKNFALNGL